MTYLCQEIAEESELINYVWEDAEVCYSFWTESFTDDISWYDNDFIIHFLIRFEVQILILLQEKFCIISTMFFWYLCADLLSVFLCLDTDLNDLIMIKLNSDLLKLTAVNLSTHNLNLKKLTCLWAAESLLQCLTWCRSSHK